MRLGGARLIVVAAAMATTTRVSTINARIWGRVGCLAGRVFFHSSHGRDVSLDHSSLF